MNELPSSNLTWNCIGSEKLEDKCINIKYMYRCKCMTNCCDSISAGIMTKKNESDMLQHPGSITSVVMDGFDADIEKKLQI